MLYNNTYDEKGKKIRIVSANIVLFLAGINAMQNTNLNYFVVSTSMDFYLEYSGAIWYVEYHGQTIGR
ncbi:hypothetical protein IKF03_02075 [Candidatus Saccharibacteria bacterium]|nr:hypothetical protein [Candidatus Saccharibacteria bacterium]